MQFVLKQFRDLVKGVLDVFHLKYYGTYIKKKYRMFNLNRKGKNLSYHLTNPGSYNFEKKQQELLYNILNYAKFNVPYYRKLMSNVLLSKNQIFNNLKELSLLSKEVIREQGTNMYSEHFESLYKNWMNTGGSTGQPLRFPVSENFEHVHQKCLYYLMGATKNDIIVSIDGTRIEEDKVKKNIFWNERLENFPWGKFHYSTLYMNDSNMKYYIDHLNLIKPRILRGYPSGFENIAKFLINNDIRLTFKIKGIYLTSEFFDHSLTELLRKSFNCPIFGQYGHSEVSVFAFTMANSLEYICSPLYGYTEVIDEEGNHVSEGEVGEVTVTGFSNKIMPFIRYRTGDIAVYGGEYKGVVKLKSLQGRSVDFVINKDNKKIYLIGLIFGGHLKSFAKIKVWQIEQTEPGLIVVRIVKDIGYTDLSENEIVQLFDSVGVKAEIKYVAEIALSNNGKRKFLVQNIKE
jgi:phenylacetate-CoA ligase